MLGITDLFPKLHAAAPSQRKLILWLAVLGLFFLASVESSLAILREHIVEAENALKMALSGSETGVMERATNSKIPVIGQAVLGFVLPWILAMVAIPLEMFLDSGRHVVASVSVLAAPGHGPPDERGLAPGEAPDVGHSRHLRRVRIDPAAHRADAAEVGAARRPGPDTRRGGCVMKRALVLVALCLVAISCDSRRYDQAIGVLIDVSGTYTDQRKETVNVVKREILPYMVPGDTMVVVRIDSESYDQENVEALLTLDHRPSHANAQKLAMARKLDEFAERRVHASYTDIPGAIMLASEYLNEVGGGSSVMLIFSDMQEDLPPGARRDMDPEELANTHVVAMNVKRLQHDTIDPAVFRKRLDAWG